MIAQAMPNSILSSFQFDTMPNVLKKTCLSRTNNLKIRGVDVMLTNLGDSPIFQPIGITS
jgi:hypothetical protein